MFFLWKFALFIWHIGGTKWQAMATLISCQWANRLGTRLHACYVNVHTRHCKNSTGCSKK